MPDLISADQTFPLDQPAQPASLSDQPATEAHTIDEGDGRGFDAQPEEAFYSTAHLAPKRIPGPGIPEAVLWMLGMLAVHMVGMVVAMTVIVVSHLSTLASPPAGIGQLVPEIRGVLQNQSHVLNLITGEMMFFVAVAVIATGLRLGRRSARRLGLRRISAPHLALIVSVSIPLSLMCGAFHHVTTEVWDSTIGNLPMFQFFQGMDVNETLKPLGELAPLWLLIAVIALAPAIGEEVIFRGVIGRGLVARHGIIAGVVMTSLMFAAVHVHPAHAIALLPLAFFIHLVYLATRSFWAPVLLHLLNNSLAATLLRYGGNLESSGLDEEAGMPLSLIALSAAIVGTAAVVLWKSRIEYRGNDGSTWDPGYPTVEAPPSAIAAVAVHRSPPTALFGLTVIVSALYTGVFIATLVTSLSPSV